MAVTRSMAQVRCLPRAPRIPCSQPTPAPSVARVREQTRGILSKNCNNDGFTTSTSGLSRPRHLEYPDVFAGEPQAWWLVPRREQHARSRAIPENMCRKAVSLGLDAEYQNTYTASLAYTNFFGGDYNTSAGPRFRGPEFRRELLSTLHFRKTRT